MNEQIVTILQRYSRGNAFIEQERIARLASMAVKESQAIFNELVEGWESVVKSERGLDRLDRWRLETTLVVRIAFLRLAEEKGLV